jgi:hypothetical protein
LAMAPPPTIPAAILPPAARAAGTNEIKEPAIVAVARNAATVFFMFLVLPEIAVLSPRPVSG